MKKQPTFWRTLRLLLGAARKRSTGRQTRQQELLSNCSGKNATDWGRIGFVFAAPAPGFRFLNPEANALRIVGMVLSSVINPAAATAPAPIGLM